MKKTLRALSLVLATALTVLGLQQAIVPAIAAVWQWSTTAGTNATADPTINWSEGMSPSSVNDSARAMMARLAEYRNDLGGLTSTAGTALAYTLTSNQGGFTPTADRDKFTIGFTAHATNSSPATIAVDGAAAKPLRSVSGAAINAGVLNAGSIYTATYKFSTDEWLVHNVRGVAAEIPIGAIIDYSSGTAPSSNYIIPTGQCISRTTYAVYFGLVGTAYGACDGVTTFGVPDLRGRVVAGLDSGAGRLTCATLGCGAQTKILATSEIPSHSHGINITSGAGAPNDHDHNITGPATLANGVQTGGTGGFWFGSAGITTGLQNQNMGHTHPVTGISDVTGGGTGFSIVQPTFVLGKMLRVL